MAIYKLVADNPTDSSFDQVRFYEADDASGTNATQLTALYDSAGSEIAGGNVPVSSNADLYNPGTTSAYFRSGNSAKYYASTWYDSDGSVETDYSQWVKGGWDRWDLMFTDWLNDSSEAVFSSTKRNLFKRSCLEALKADPSITYEAIDVSLTTVSTRKTYSIPFGFSGIHTVATSTNGSPDDSDYLIWLGWIIENNKLVFPTYPTAGLKIRLIGSKYYLNPSEVPARYDGLVLTFLRASAYESMADDYPQFEKFAQLQKGSNVTFPQLRLEARQLYDKFERDKVSISTIKPSIDKMR